MVRSRDTPTASLAKGRHSAALNCGDCVAYAAARLSAEPLFAPGGATQCGVSSWTSCPSSSANRGNASTAATALLLAAIMVALLAAHYLTRINGMLLFWLAFILTRPLGAVVGNILSKSPERGGLNWGNAGATGVLEAALIGLVAYQTVHVRRNPLPPLPAPVNRRTGERQRPNGQLITLPRS